MIPRVVRAALLACSLACSACGGSGERPASPNPSSPTPPPTSSGLRSPSALSAGCYDWPALAWTPNHYAETRTRLGAEPAIDFTLRSVDGRPTSLGSLLETRPVLLVQGSLTCPLYRRSIAPLNALARTPYDASTTFADRVHILHVYTIEAHPQAPDVSPYSGELSEKEFSTVRQAQTYERRVEDARTARALVDGTQFQLVDDLSNPVWCSYGTCPNCAFLIGRDGVIRNVQLVLSVPEMERAIRELVN